MNGDRLADLSLLAIQVAEDHVHFERVVLEACRAAQFFNRLIDLVGDKEVQTEDVVRGLACAAPVEPLAVAQLVALPGLADGEPGQEGEKAGEQRLESVHARCASASRERSDDGVPAALGAQNQLEELPGGAASTRRGRDPVHALADFRHGVGRRGRQTHARQHGDVHDVVAHVRDFVVVQADIADDFARTPRSCSGRPDAQA